MSFLLQPGDLVRVVAPAGQGSLANLPKIQSYIESLGLVAQISESIYDTSDPFYSNSDEFRSSDLISAILDDKCKVIWCIRGGAGCIRLIKYLEAQLPEGPIQPRPKILIGFSDITVLHLYMAKKYNWPTIHGPMLDGIVSGAYDSSPESVKALTDLLFVSKVICEPTLTRIDPGAPIVSLNGLSCGGNLTLVECSIGTNWAVNAAGKFLFLEDTGEAPYRLERSLDHMKQAGVFEGAEAIIFGDFTGADASMVSYVLLRFAADEDIKSPVFVLKGIGHGPVNIPFPMNTPGLMVLADVGISAYRLCFGDNIPEQKDYQ